MHRVRHAGINDELKELYGDNLAGSPAFTRLLIDGGTPADVARSDDQIFVEHNPEPLNPLLDTLKQEGLFTIVRTDEADTDGGVARSLYDAAVAAGANVLVTDFVVPQTFEGSGCAAKLPCNDTEFCTLS